MAFNFGSLAETKPASTVSYLKPYTINENVVIKSTDVKEGVTASTGKAWKKLDITFGNDEGVFTESIFWITEQSDFERGEYDTSNGGKRETPSRWERTQNELAAIGYAFFPESFEKLKAVSSKAKSFDDIILAFKKMADAAVNKKSTSMKLIGRNSNGRVYAALPSCVGIAQATEKTAASNGVEVGQWYTWMVSPFGDKLYFSPYEETQRANYTKATPTTMPKDPLTDTTNVDTDENDFNLEDLL